MRIFAASSLKYNVEDLRSKDQRTDTPERSVNIRAAMFIEASSWNSSFAA
jgi:hypothetical protein